MAEKKYKLDYDGQAVTQSDLNLLGEVSSLADDRVLAELLRLTPYDGVTVTKGILTSGHATSGNTALVAPNGASGSVLVQPFRAVVGARTAVGTDAQKALRDIRSALSVTEGTTSLTQSVSIAANSSGNPRWDLVYAAVAIDANGPTTSRLVKDPSTGSVGSQTIAQFSRCVVTLGVTAGTAAASPVWPATPSDAGSTYYVPLAYVRVPNGFGASSTVATTDIALQANVLRISGAVGASVGVADSNRTVSSARQQAWGSSGTRPNIFLPPSMHGGESLVSYVDFSNATSSAWSHQNNDVIDSRDWRGRLCRGIALVRPSTGSSVNGYTPGLDATPAWNTSAGSQGFPDSTNAYWPDALGVTTASTVSFLSHTINTRSGNVAWVAFLDGTKIYALGSGTVRLYCDFADSGKLKITFTNTDPGRCHILFWLDFTGPFANK